MRLGQDAGWQPSDPQTHYGPSLAPAIVGNKNYEVMGVNLSRSRWAIVSETRSFRGAAFALQHQPLGAGSNLDPSTYGRTVA